MSGNKCSVVMLLVLLVVEISLAKATYRSRNRRELTLAGDPETFDVTEVEKYIVGEFGARACIFERVCAHYATRAQAQPRPQFDWPDVFSQYKRSPDQAKEFYLLSVFMGDIVGSPQLCHQLGKRRSCDSQQYGVAQYKRSPDQAKEFYLLSVFMGDIVGSPQLCHQLGKRRSCDSQQYGVA